MAYHLDMVSGADEARLKILRDSLHAYNCSVCPAMGTEPAHLAIYLLDSKGEVQGGLVARPAGAGSISTTSPWSQICAGRASARG